MIYRQVPIDATPGKRPNKSRFNLSHERKQAIKIGKLTPILCIPTLPGDDFEIDTEFMFNFNPLFYPIMHFMDMTCDYYYVPNRICWPEVTSVGQDLTDNPGGGWTKWITEQYDGPHPFVNAPCAVADITISGANAPYNITIERRTDTPLGPCLGLPGTFNDISAGPDKRFKDVIEGVNALPFVAYWAIWNEYYRNPHVEPELNLRYGGFNDDNPPRPGDFTRLLNTQDAGNENLFYLANAYWNRDYFTDATPTPQIGDAINIPISAEQTKVRPVVPTALASPYNLQVENVNSEGEGGLARSPGGNDLIIDNAGTIRELRFAEALQSYYERVVRIGQRYRDFIKGLWGNDPQPGVVDVPIFFGRKYGRIQISEQTTTADTIYSQEFTRETGDYVGRAFMYKAQEDRLRCYCGEHGWIMAILSIKPNTSYGQGISRWFRYEVPQDYPLDMFTHIGDQEIAQEEFFYWGGLSDQEANKNTFGYIPRYSEMKYHCNQTIGILNYVDNLSKHLGRYWTNDYFIDNADDLNDLGLLGLTPNFIQMRDDSANSIAGGLRTGDAFRVMRLGSWVGAGELTEEPCYAHMLHSIYVDRSLPYYSTPDLT